MASAELIRCRVTPTESARRANACHDILQKMAGYADALAHPLRSESYWHGSINGAPRSAASQTKFATGEADAQIPLQAHQPLRHGRPQNRSHARGELRTLTICTQCGVSRHGSGTRTGLVFTGHFEKLEILEQPGILSKRGFRKGKVTSVGRLHTPKRFHSLLRLENGRVALEVDVEKS